MKTPTSIAASREITVAGKQLELPFTYLSDLVATAPAEPPWIWEGILVPGAITLIGGKPKTGKSSLVMALLPHLFAGEPFLGLATRATRLVLLSEEGPDTVVEKARQFGAGDVSVLCYPWVANRAWYEVVASAVVDAKTLGAGMLVVDTLNTWAGLRGEAENQAGAVLEIVQPLRTAAAEGLAVLVVVHHRKSGGDYGDAIRGSSALAGAVDIVVDLERSKLGPTTRVLRSVSRFRSTPPELVVELDGGDYLVLGDAATARAEHEADEIVEALGRLGETRLERLSNHTDIPERTLRRRLDALGNRVERLGTGRRGDPYRYRVSCQPPESLRRPVRNGAAR